VAKILTQWYGINAPIEIFRYNCRYSQTFKPNFKTKMARTGKTSALLCIVKNSKLLDAVSITNLLFSMHVEIHFPHYSQYRM
jgi:hypothetical protein